MSAPLPPQKTIKPVNPLNKTVFNARLAITVSIIAIVFAVSGFLFGAINYHSLINRNASIHALSQNNLKMQSILSTLLRDAQQHGDQLLALQKQLQTVENEQNVPLQRTMAQVTYLIHLANLHLTLERDRTTALNLLHIAEQHIAPIQNTVFLPLKQALLSDIRQLNTAPGVNINEIYTTLETLRNQIQQLNPLPTQASTSFQETLTNLKNTPAKTTHWYEKLLESLKQIKQIFIIHEIDNPTAPVTAPDKLFYIKQNIQVKLNIAQWALLHGNAAIYQSSLKTVSEWLTQYFSMSASTEFLLKQLQSLEKENITVTLPTLDNTLNALGNITLSLSQRSVSQKLENAQEPKKSPSPITPETTTPLEPANSVETDTSSDNVFAFEHLIGHASLNIFQSQNHSFRTAKLAILLNQNVQICAPSERLKAKTLSDEV